MKKRVILHIGFHKTGSSALQVFFATNAARLAAAGIGYPYPDQEHIVAIGECSGNVIQVLYLGGFMDGFDPTIEEPKDRMNETYFDALIEVINSVPQQTVLISGEILGLVSDKHLTHFIGNLRLNHDIKIVCYVRDPFDFVFSAWRQGLMDARQVSGFSDYVGYIVDGKRSLSMLDSFALFEGLGLPLSVINFDHHRRDIAAPFLRAIDAENMLHEVERTTEREANRSLTPSEACLATLLYEKVSSLDVTATFLRAARVRDRQKPSDYYNRSQHQRILDRYAATISSINRHLPVGQKLATTVRTRADADFVVMPEDVALLLDLLGKLAVFRVKPRTSVVASNLAGVVVLPPDFDPEAYLFHNADVVAAKLDPAEHYLAHGWREGRRYRFF